MPAHNIFRNDKVHVMAEECKTCIFNPHDRFVDGKRVAGMVTDTMDEPGATIVCHSTLYNADGKNDTEHAICKGWYDRLGSRDSIVQLANHMGIIEYQLSSDSEQQTPKSDKGTTNA